MKSHQLHWWIFTLRGIVDLNLLEYIINLECKKMKNIVVKDKIINVTGVKDDDYVSLTDIARFKLMVKQIR